MNWSGKNNCGTENDSNYSILHVDDRKFKSHLLQVLLKNGFKWCRCVWTSGEFLPGTLPTLTGSSFEPLLNLELDNDDRWHLEEFRTLTLDSDLILTKENRSYMAIILFSSSTGYLHRHWLRVGNTAIIFKLVWDHIKWHGDIPLVHVSDAITTQVKAQYSTSENVDT